MVEELKKTYLAKLEQMELECRRKKVTLKAEGADDDSILESIKSNVIDIFYKMFEVSYNKTCLTKEKTEEQKVTELRGMYLAFFEKIPSAWKVKMEKDKEHNMMSQYYIEVIKLEVADNLKALFMSEVKEMLEGK